MDQQITSNTTLTKLATVLAVLLIIFVGAKTVATLKGLPAAGNTSTVPETISVTGKGEVVIKPDIATFNFTVSEEAPVVSTAQDKANKKAASILEYLEKSGVESKDVKTVAYDIYPRYDYQTTSMYRGKQVLAAYVVSQTVEVKVRKLEDAGKVLTDIGEFGPSNVSGLSFSVDEQDKVAREARDKAIADAREQAEKLAKALGVRLGKISSFYESTPYQPYPLYYAKDAAVGMGGAMNQSVPAELPGGESKITSIVTITYGIK